MLGSPFNLIFIEIRIGVLLLHDPVMFAELRPITSIHGQNIFFNVEVVEWIHFMSI